MRDNPLITNLRPALTMMVFFTLLFGLVYTLVVTEVAQIFFTEKANGSLVQSTKNKNVGSELVGQNFDRPEYFWGRLSATSGVAYNAAASSGSNYGNQNPKLVEAAKARIEELHKHGGESPVPVDLVTASGSGLDPHITIAAAEYQVARVAKFRKINEAEVLDLVKQYTEKRQFGIFGEPRVNVLKINMALDRKTVVNAGQ